MIARNLITAVLAGLAVLAALAPAGCTELRRPEPYTSLADVAEAKRRADLVVEGEVLETLPTETRTSPNPFDDPFGGPLGECAIKTRVSLNLKRVIKGPEDLKGPVRFLFYSPCYHGDPGVLMGWSLPAAMIGDRLRVFLVKRGDEYWLIAHERWYRQWASAPRVRRGPIREPGARYIEIPAPEPGAEGAAVAGAVPGAPAAAVPGQTPGAAVPPPPAAAATGTVRVPPPGSTQQPTYNPGDIVYPPPGSRTSKPATPSRFPRRTGDRWWP